MHIVIFNHYAGSPKMGMEYRPYYLAQEWIKNGHKVTIVAGTYSHIRTENKKIDKRFLFENIDGIDYVWINTVEYKGNGIKRIISMFQYILGLYKLIPQLKKSNPDAVIASSTYPLDNYPANKLAKKTKAQFIYEVHDLWPLSPQLLGGYSKYHPFIMVMQKAENFAYKHVDKVISILPCAEEHMKQHGLKDGKFYHVPNGIYLPEVSNPEPLNENILNQLPKDKKIIGYCGTFGIANALHNLVEVAKMVEKSHPDFFFALVGKGPEKENLQKLIDKYELNNIKLFDAIPKKQVQSFLALCNTIIIIILNDTGIYKYGISPNKIFDYMYSAKPIIQAVEAGNDIPRDANCGITCATTPEAIKESLLSLYSLSDEEKRTLGKNGHKYVLENHTYEVLADNFIKILEK